MAPNQPPRLKEQLQEIAIELMAIRPKIDPHIIKQAVQLTGDSQTVIYRYLKGEVKKVPVGNRILNCFKNLVSEVA